MSTKNNKKIIIQITIFVVSLLTLSGGAALLYNQILPSFKTLWFLLFFIGFAVFMTNLCMILKIGDYTRFFKN